MPITITMPALSPTMEEGNLAKWLVKEGDAVVAGDVVAEIETDKATMEVEAVDEGTVAKIIVPEGTEAVKVNAVIAVLAADGESVEEASASAGAAPPPAFAPLTQTDTVAAALAPTPQNSAAIPQAASPATSTAPSGDKTSRRFASPLARRIAGTAGIDLGAIAGSGPHGRIVKRDVAQAIEKGVAAPVAKPAATPASATGPSDDQVLALFEEGSYELVKHDNMRKTIAKRLIEAKSSIPHFYLSIDCELDKLLALRAEINASAPQVDDKPAFKISVNDFVIKALAKSLEAVPDANVSWTEANMVKHRHADVGVAVSIPGGLITPIVRSAETKSLSAISNEMKELAGRARNRKLLPHEYQGGSSAVSNLGMFGIRDFSAVINPPHATILAVGAGEKRAVVRGSEIEVATVMCATMSTDHRCVDGALGAQLLGAFKTMIENPMGMLV